MTKKITRYTSGRNNTYLNEPLREPKVVSGEYWISSDNNSHIRLGRDRYGGPHEGKGSLRQGACGAIDLFVGAGPKDERGKPSSEETKKNYMNPDFINDSARVYISQRSDIDLYFGIESGNEKTSTKNRSAIGLKADQIRVFAGQHVKIVTGKAAANGLGTDGASNSLGGAMNGGGRIEFIVGNNLQDRSGGQPALQPVPLGDNLENLLVEIIDLISSLRSIAGNNTKYIQEVASALVKHVHPNTPQPIPGVALVSPIAIAEMMPMFGKSLSQNTIGTELHKFNTKVVNLNYLNPFAPEYILSTGVYTT